MQTKSSYRVLKWAFLSGMAMSLATACVVSSGDGDDDGTDLTDGGDGGTNTTAGKSSGGGGSSSGGTTAGSKATGGSSDDGGEPAMPSGGTPSTFVPGECQTDEPLQPTMLPVCDEAAGDTACLKCLKLQACDEFKTCFGEEPSTACSVGMTAGADGQFACVTKCFADGAAGAVDADMLLGECASQCDECGTGGLNDETSALIEAGNDPAKCQSDCFPFE